MSTESDPQASAAVSPSSIRFSREIARAIQQGKFLAKETERGCILVAAAMFETHLEEILLSFLTPGNTSKYLVGRKGPLAAFGARIEACYCLGLITLEEKRWLQFVEVLRNLCAHRWDMSNFDEVLSELDEKLTVQHRWSLELLEKTRDSVAGGRSSPDGVRLTFEHIVANVMVNMLYRPSKVAAEQRKVRTGTD